MIDDQPSVPEPFDLIINQSSVPEPEADQFIMIVIPPPPELPNLGFTTLL